MFYPTPVSVCGTAPVTGLLSGFSREHGYHRYPLARGLAVLSRFTRRRVLNYAAYATRFNALFRQCAVCHFSVAASLRAGVPEC